jgi:hypothetical protein
VISSREDSDAQEASQPDPAVSYDPPARSRSGLAGRLSAAYPTVIRNVRSLVRLRGRLLRV